MPDEKPTVYIVDDDPGFRESASLMVRSMSRKKAKRAMIAARRGLSQKDIMRFDFEINSLMMRKTILRTVET